MRLQAYERMALFCSRIEMSQLVNNTAATTEMSAEMYKTALIMQVEEEFHHNITQQVYMTDDLWNIILLAKKEVIRICEKIYQDVESAHQDQNLQGQASATAFLEALVKYMQDTPQIGYVHALTAIKKEVGILFG
jgi:RimJ/RimL family protein N-acetyltransferase